MSRRNRTTQNYYSRNYSLLNVNAKANMALKGVKDIESRMNVEYKYSDSALNASLSTTSVVLPLTEIPDGPLPTERNGDQCKMVSLEGKILITPDVGSDDTNVRLLIVKDTLHTGTDPVMLDVLDEETSFAMRNMDNKNRFIILLDRIMFTGGNTDVARYVKFYKKVTLKLHYDRPTQTDKLGCHLFFMAVSNEAPEGVEPTVNARFRTRFLDN